MLTCLKENNTSEEIIILMDRSMAKIRSSIWNMIARTDIWKKNFIFKNFANFISHIMNCALSSLL